MPTGCRVVASLRVSLVVLIFCAWSRSAAQDSVPTDPLPPVFRGITWTTTPTDLKSLFSTTDVYETTWECLDGSRCVTWGTTAPGWMAFGRALVELSARVGQTARLITVYADSLDEPGPAMDAAFARMKKVLEAQLGKGKSIPSYSSGTAHGFKRDPRERAVRWKRRGYVIELQLGADEGGWNVTVQAFRGWE